MNPRFSVVLPVHDRADVIGRATAGVLAQTFGDLEVIVVDDGSTDDSVAAARAVSDGRVRIVRQEHAGFQAALTSGISRASGDWCVILEPDDEVAPGWLARLGRLIDSTGAGLVSCGGDQRHLDGSFTTVAPQPVGPPHDGVSACFRPGSFATSRQVLLDIGSFGGPGDDLTLTEVGLTLVSELVARGATIVSTPERLVQWNERLPDDDCPCGEELRLRWALQAIDAVARTPIPDGELLARYATIGGVAAARLRQRGEARRLFRLARRVSPDVAKHWARWAVSCLPPVSDKIWEPGDDVAPEVDRDVADVADVAGDAAAEDVDADVDAGVHAGVDENVPAVIGSKSLSHDDERR